MLRATNFHELQKRGIPMVEWEGVQVPRSFSDPRKEWSAVRSAAGLLDLGFRGWIEVTGEDRVRFLHGMISNDVKALSRGQGCAALLLDVQGHILADLRVFAETDRLFLETGLSLTERVLKMLDHHIIMDQVELADQSGAVAIMGLEGPTTPEIVRSLFHLELEALSPFGHSSFSVQGIPGRLLKVSNCGYTGAEFMVESSRAGELWNILLGALGPGGPVGLEAMNVLRVEAGIPWYGFEMDDRTLPQEVGLETTAVSFTKGCYVGQEIVERIRSRGEVHRTLAGVILSSLDGSRNGWDRIEPVPSTALRAGTAARRATPLFLEGKEVGRLTSAVHSFALERPIGLAILRREANQPGTQLTFEAGTAEVTILPFVKFA